jgi:tetratricopeptide (TPR) repeat protein
MRTGEMKALPGASDPEYVHSNPAWYPDGKTLVFVRAKAKDAYVDGRALASYPNDPLETPVQYDLYRMPFNDGQGGKAEPVRGASDNGMSNNFPKVSPDGRWIVFVKCKNGLLMRPDSRLWIVPLEGGEAREMRCNLSLMNSWHSFSPNGRWLVFASKANTPYTQMFLTHIDEQGNDSPAILVPNSTAANRAVNIPEFVAVRAEELLSIKAPAVDYYRHVERGDTFSEKRRLEEAAAEYRKALQSEPESSRIHFKLGSVLLEVARGQWAGGDRETAERGRDEAAAHLRKAIEIDPRNAKSHIVLGLIHTTRNESEEAAKCFRRAIESDPLNVAGYDYLGEILLDQKKLPEAIEYFKRAVDIVPDVKMNCFLARLLVQDGRHGQAIEYLKKAVEADPRHPGARLELGDLLVSEGKPEEAGGHFLEALRIDPRNAQAHDRLGAVLLKQGKTIEAIRHFKEALAINPGYSPARANLEAATRALRE